MKMNDRFQKLRGMAALALCAISLTLCFVACGAESAKKVPLPLQLPDATTKGTPEDIPVGPHIEKAPNPDKPNPRPAFLAPAGVKNVAFGKKPTSSVTKLWSGTLEQITDGHKDPIDDDVVELRKGVQWVQLDLEKDYAIYAIVIWHDHCWLQVFHDVIVQAADDPQFSKNVRTLFNNDVDNSAGLGMGTDKEYFETNEGKLIDAKGIKARYLRFYTNGCSMNEGANRYQEIEVYALPVGQ